MNEIGITAHELSLPLEAAILPTLQTICDSSASRLRFYGAYPALARITARRCRLWVSSSSELIERLWRDRSALEEWLNAEALSVTAASDALGDEHWGGRAVIALDTTGGRIVYKPRPVSLQTALADLSARLQRATRAAQPIFRVADTLSREGYGWVKWVDRIPIGSDAQARAYYTNLGSLLAAAWCLSATDLHGENIIACGEWPVLIDTETFFGPRRRDPRWGAAAYRESIAGIGILPILVRGREDTFIDVSAFGAERPKARAPESAFFALFGDNLEQPIPHGLDNSVPTTRSGYRLNRERWYPSFLAGFRSSLNLVAANRDTVGQILESFRGHPTRVLMRDTADYCLLLADSLHPDLLSDGLLRQRHMEAMRRSSEKRPEMTPLVDDEIRSLCDGDVPAFVSSTTSRTLRSAGGTVVDDMFTQSGFDVVASRVAGLNRRVIERLVWAARAGLGCHSLNTSGLTMRNRRQRPSTSVHDAADLTEAALAVGYRLIALSYDEVDPCWLDIHTEGGTRWSLNIGDTSLYRGQVGYLLFFAHLAALTGDSRVVETRDRLATSWLKHCGKSLAIGAFDGAAGELYVAARLCDLLPDLNSVVPFGALTGTLEESLETDSQPADIISGSAGVLLMLLNAPGQHAAVLRDAVLRKLARRLVDASHTAPTGIGWPMSTGEMPVTAAHGTAGIEYVLRLLAELLPDMCAELHALACAAWSWQDANFVSSAGNWRDLRTVVRVPATKFSTSWCNGSAGIGLYRIASAYLSLTTPEDRERMIDQFEDALAVSLRRGLGFGQTLCHGDLSVAELCLTAGHLLDRPDLLRRSRDIAGSVSAWIGGRSGRTDAGYPAMQDLPGFMSGAAGIGYELLRVAHPDAVPTLFLLDEHIQRRVHQHVQSGSRGALTAISQRAER